MAHPLDKYRHLVPDSSAPREYWKQLAINEFTNGLERLLDKLDMNQADLARALRLQGPTVNRALRGHQNLSIDTMSKYADFFGAAVHIVLLPKGARWRIIEGDQGVANKLWRLGSELASTRVKRAAGSTAQIELGDHIPRVDLQIPTPRILMTPWTLPATQQIPIERNDIHAQATQATHW